MKKVNAARKVLHKDTTSRMRDFLKFNDMMDRITKSLEAYLEEKRMDFPRFYFISNEELLQLLAKQQEIEQVQRYLGNLFEGVHKLYIKDMSLIDTIDGIISAEGEMIEFFPRTIKIRSDKGIEFWLQNLEREMFAVIQRRIKEAV